MLKLRTRAMAAILTLGMAGVASAEDYTSYVNPFVGTTNFGTTDIMPLGTMAPGLVVPKFVVPTKGFT